MGVPKFFRYMSERYPCLSELLRENQVPEFDNLYLDMNGIIHNCSHPNDGDINFRIEEEGIFNAIFNYVEFLFKLIRPQKVFFIAVDGVAPRAKMNQQRGRRFRSALEAHELLERAKANGDPIPADSPFDSNCITPGTPFMVRLQNALEHFIQVKIASDRLWKACTVILSGHETPGEGEHKIMEYIRHAKAQPGFNPNLRHCLYGLDADLIMLGLCTHERYFSLLREEVKFGKTDKKETVLKDIRFYLLHLTLLSEYLEMEFASIRDRLRFPFDINKLIDDWVLMGYLVGNDFIPHIPHLHINENALPILYSAYKDVLPEMDGYINEGGILNLPRLQLLMRRLADIDRQIFLDRYTELKYLEEKCGKNNLEAFDVDAGEIIASSEMDQDLVALIMSSEMLDSDEKDNEAPVTVDDMENDPELFEKEFQSYKRNYYMSKMGYADFTEEVRAEQTECYIRALQWTLHYYYRGVVSWSWYYPHHYAPFISDVDNFADLKLEYETARPFLPFQQLLSVLPAASKQHLPPAYHELMTDPNSSVYDFYPTDFRTDLNGKQQTWEAVVLIPFIDEKRLLKAMGPCDAFLTDEEKQRNVHGPMLKFQYDANQTAPLEAKYGFSRIDELPVRRNEIWRDQLHVSENKLVLGPSEGAVLHGYAKGFPTFSHLPHHGELKSMHVKIFNFASKNDSMVVVLDPPADQTSHLNTAELATNLLGKIVHVSWPHLMEAIVVRVSDGSKTYERNSEPLQTDERSFKMSCLSITEHNNNRLAIDVGTIKQLVHVRIAVGTEYVLQNYGFVLKKMWHNITVAYPAQAIVHDLQDVMKQEKTYLEMHEMFPAECVTFLRATEFYGSMGHVVDVSATTKRVQAKFLVYEEPDLGQVFYVHRQSLQAYRNVNDTASMLGISVGLLLQLTGSLLVAPGGHRALNVGDKTFNIGLRLRMMSKDEETVGYSRKVNKIWLFSEKTIELIEKYLERLPDLSEKFKRMGRTNIYFETDLFGEGNEGKLKELHDWLNLQDHTNAERRSCGIMSLEHDAIDNLIEVIDKYGAMHQPKVQTMFVDPKDLYRPGMKNAKVIDPSATFELLDRVIVVQDKEDVPVGARGTIIGIHRVSDPNPVRREAIGQEDINLEILFDKAFDKGVCIYNVPGTEKRIMRLAQGAVMNISYGKASAGYRYKVVCDRSVSDEQGTAATTVLGCVKSNATADSIQRRLNERIGKRTNVWNGNHSFDGTSMEKPTQQDSMHSKETDQQRKIEFERLWRKLKESPNETGALFDDTDIESFVQTARHSDHHNNGSAINRVSTEKSSLDWKHRVKHGNVSKNAFNSVEQWSTEKRSDYKNNESITNSLSVEKVSWRTRNKQDEQWNGDHMEQWSTEKHSDCKNNESITNSSSVEKVSWRTRNKQDEQWNGDHMAGYLKQMLRIDDNGVQEKKINQTTSMAVPAPASLPKPPIQWQRMATAKSFTEGSSTIVPFTAPPQNMLPMVQPSNVPTSFRAMMGPPTHINNPPHQQMSYPPMHMQPAFVSPGMNMHQPFGGFQQPSMVPPPFAQRMPIRPPIPFANAVHQQQQQPQPQVQEQYPPTWGPKGPQHLSYNKNNPAGKGAFVPLQAMKKTIKTKSLNSDNLAANNTSVGNDVNHMTIAQTSIPIATTGSSNSFNEKNARRRQEVEQKQAEVKQGFASFLSQKPDSKQQKNKHNSATFIRKPSSADIKDRDEKNGNTATVKNVKSRPKTRIAARFGVTPDG